MQKTESVIDVTTFGNKFFKFLTGTVSGAVTAVVFAFIFAFILTIGSVPDSLVTAAAYITLALSSCVCGFVTVLRLKDAGLFNGIISGLCFFLLYVIMSAIFGSTPFFSVSTLITLAICVVLSALGGVIAVNINMR